MEAKDVTVYPWALSELSIQLLYDLEQADLGARWSTRLNRFGREAYGAGEQEGKREAGLQLRAKIGGVDEISDWSDEGMLWFRKDILQVVKKLLKEWGIKDDGE